MLKILKNETVAKVWVLLPAYLHIKFKLETLKQCRSAQDNEFLHEPRSQTAKGLLAECIQEVAYREENGIDGNWHEWARDWFTQDDYEDVLEAMEDCGNLRKDHSE